MFVTIVFLWDFDRGIDIKVANIFWRNSLYVTVLNSLSISIISSLFTFSIPIKRNS